MSIAIALNLLHDIVEEGALGGQPTCQPQSLQTQVVPTEFLHHKCSIQKCVLIYYMVLSKLI